VASILLLTDGLDSNANNLLQSLVQQLPNSCSVHSFGYGEGHDAHLLGRLAELTNGTFTYVEDEKMIGAAFGNCMGGLFSVVAQNLVIEFELSKHVHVEKVLSHYKSEISRNSVKIFISDMFAEESRDVILCFDVPRASVPSGDLTSIARAKVEYTDPLIAAGLDNKRTTEIVEYKISRPITSNCRDSNPKLLLQRKRINVVDALTQAADAAEQKNFSKATSIVEDAIRNLLDLPPDAIIDSVPKPQDPLLASLFEDLRQCKARVLSQQAWRQDGYAFVQNQQMQHKQQRNQSSKSSPYMTERQSDNVMLFL